MRAILCIVVAFAKHLIWGCKYGRLTSAASHGARNLPEVVWTPWCHISRWPFRLVFLPLMMHLWAQCFCGKGTDNYDHFGKSSFCNSPCSGDSEDTCGGHFIVDVYRYSEFVKGGLPTSFVHKRNQLSWELSNNWWYCLLVGHDTQPSSLLWPFRYLHGSCVELSVSYIDVL